MAYVSTTGGQGRDVGRARLTVYLCAHLEEVPTVKGLGLPVIPRGGKGTREVT